MAPENVTEQCIVVGQSIYRVRDYIVVNDVVNDREMDLPLLSDILFVSQLARAFYMPRFIIVTITNEELLENEEYMRLFSSKINNKLTRVRAAYYENLETALEELRYKCNRRNLNNTELFIVLLEKIM